MKGFTFRHATAALALLGALTVTVIHAQAPAAAPIAEGASGAHEASKGASAAGDDSWAADSKSASKSNSDSKSKSNFDAKANSDPKSKSKSNFDATANSDPKSNSNFDSDSDSRSDSKSKSDLNSNSNSISDSDSDSDSDTDSRSGSDSDSRERSRRRRHGGRDVGQGGDLVSIGHDSTLAAGQRADSVVSIFGSSTVNGESDDVVSILGTSRITGTARGDAVSILGTTVVDGRVAGDAVAVVGNVELGPHADVSGDVVAVLGSVHRDPGAIVHGGVESILTADFGEFTGLQTWIRHCLLYARPLALVSGMGWAWSLALGLLAFYACLALLFPGAVNRCVQTFEAQPGRSLLAALIAMLLSPILIVLLCVTVIGIAAVPFVTVALVGAGLFGRVVILAWLGGRLIDRHAAGRLRHPAVAVIIGGVLVLALYLVPVLGFLVFQLLGVLGFGVVVYTLILALRAHQAAKDVGGSPGNGPTNGAPGPANAVPARAAAGAYSAAAPSAASVAAEAPTVASAAAAGSATAPSVVSSTTAPSAVGSAAPWLAAAEAPAAAAASAAAAGSASAPSAATAAAEERPAATATGGASPTSAAARPRVTASMPRAGFWIRMAALLIDVLLVGFLMSALHHVFHLQLLVLAVYGAVMWKLRGSTVGGIVFDLQVVRLDGRDIDWETAIVRALGCFLSLAVVGLGFMWIAFDAGNQAWHDKIAGTVVVRVPKGIPLV